MMCLEREVSSAKCWMDLRLWHQHLTPHPSTSTSTSTSTSPSRSTTTSTWKLPDTLFRERWVPKLGNTFEKNEKHWQTLAKIFVLTSICCLTSKTNYWRQKMLTSKNICLRQTCCLTSKNLTSVCFGLWTLKMLLIIQLMSRMFCRRKNVWRLKVLNVKMFDVKKN